MVAMYLTSVIFSRRKWGAEIYSHQGLPMARPASGTNLTIAELQRVLNQKQSELNKLHRQRENLQRKMDLIDRQIERVGGDGGGAGMRAGGGGGGRRPRNEHSLL